MSTTLSILLAGRGQDSSDKCKDILAALADYGVTQADLDELSGLIAAFDALAPKPQAARASAKSAGQALDAAFDRADGLLNNGFDKLMLQFEDRHPDFSGTIKTPGSSLIWASPGLMDTLGAVR